MTGWDPAVATVAVKRARDRFAAELRPVTQARAAIEQSVADALRAGPAPQREPMGAARLLLHQDQIVEPR